MLKYSQLVPTEKNLTKGHLERFSKEDLIKYIVDNKMKLIP
jgi:hypothetical protein